MALRIGSIVMVVDDFERALAFWSAALDAVPRHEPDVDWAILDHGGSSVALSLDSAGRAPAYVPPRIHLDLYADDQAVEVARLKALGATEVHWDKRPVDADYVIMQDPDGNRFCVVQV
jgi:catechol 2,3-dioxygenase-like lactoylglutathione lyase family enzyme